MNEEIKAIRLLKQGEIVGLDILVQLYFFEAVRAAYLITRDKSLAEDITQSAFIKFFERVAQFDETRPFRPYFLRIVTNDAIKQVSRQPANLALAESVPYQPGLGSANYPHGLEPETWLEQAETRQEIWEALAQLTPAQRGVIVQRYYLALSEKEIAEREGIKAGAVKNRLHTARQRLRSLMKTGERR